MEKIKGLSCARAAQLRPDTVREDDVLAAYTDDDLVGHPCQDVVTPSCSALSVEHLRREGDPLRHGVELEGVREHTPSYDVIELDSEKALVNLRKPAHGRSRSRGSPAGR
jgi:hypothetical protein